jgi:hypothetical protein
MSGSDRNQSFDLANTCQILFLIAIRSAFTTCADRLFA